MAFGAYIKGFVNHIRHIMTIDKIALKQSYKGTIYIISAIDGNEQIYFLTFDIGDGDNDASNTQFSFKS